MFWSGKVIDDVCFCVSLCMHDQCSSYYDRFTDPTNALWGRDQTMSCVDDSSDSYTSAPQHTPPVQTHSTALAKKPFPGINSTVLIGCE